MHDDIVSKRKEKHAEFSERCSKLGFSKMSKNSVRFSDQKSQVMSPIHIRNGKGNMKEYSLKINKNYFIKPKKIRATISAVTTPKVSLAQRIKIDQNASIDNIGDEKDSDKEKNIQKKFK